MYLANVRLTSDFRGHSTVPGQTTVMGMQQNKRAATLHLQITNEEHMNSTATFPDSTIRLLLQQFYRTALQSLLTKGQVLIRLSKISAVMIYWTTVRGLDVLFQLSSFVIMGFSEQVLDQPGCFER